MKGPTSGQAHRANRVLLIAVSTVVGAWSNACMQIYFGWEFTSNAADGDPPLICQGHRWQIKIPARDYRQIFSCANNSVANDQSNICSRRTSINTANDTNANDTKAKRTMNELTIERQRMNEKSTNNERTNNNEQTNGQWTIERTLNAERWTSNQRTMNERWTND